MKQPKKRKRRGAGEPGIRRLYGLFEPRGDGYRQIGRLTLTERPEEILSQKMVHGGYIGTALVSGTKLDRRTFKIRLVPTARVEWKILTKEEARAFEDEVKIMRMERALGAESVDQTALRKLVGS